MLKKRPPTNAPNVRRLTSVKESELVALNELPADPYGSGDEEAADKDEEAAALAAELEETMSRAGSEWSNLAWYGDSPSEFDRDEYELRKVSGFTFARPRHRVSGLVGRAKESASRKRDKASAFVDRRVQKTAEAGHKFKENREAALSVIKRAAREKKRKMANRGKAVRDSAKAGKNGTKAAAKDAVLAVHDKAVAARDTMSEKREAAQAVLQKNLRRGAGNAASPADEMAAARAASFNMLPSSRWDQPSEPPPCRGPNYFEDSKKIQALGGPLCELFAAQVFELEGEHMAGASACLLEAGTLAPPRSARFVITVHFMTPRPGRGTHHHSIMAHAYSATTPEEAPGAAGGLLRELWKGDAVNALTRMKLLAALRSGPHLVRATMAWLGLDETRPMLLCRQVHASVNRATFAHKTPAPYANAPTTYEHVEVCFDAAASPLCNQMYKYAWPSLQTVDVTMTLLLEGRALAELPEHHVAAWALHNLEPTELSPQPPEWPTDPSQVPGEMVGSYTSGRDAKDIGSWQSTREILTKASSAKKKGWLG